MSELKDLLAAQAGIKEDLVVMQAQALALATTLDTVLVNIAALKEQVANGSPVTQADLDSLVSDAQAADAAGEDVKATLTAAQAKADAGVA